MGYLLQDIYDPFKKEINQQYLFDYSYIEEQINLDLIRAGRCKPLGNKPGQIWSEKTMTTTKRFKDQLISLTQWLKT